MLALLYDTLNNAQNAFINTATKVTLKLSVLAYKCMISLHTFYLCKGKKLYFMLFRILRESLVKFNYGSE